MLDLLSIGGKLHAKYWDDEFYAAEVLAISKSKRRSKAPVKVRYLGYGSESDAWLPCADLKSKGLPKAQQAVPAACEAPAKSLAALERGTKLQAKSAADGIWYSAEVVVVSSKKKHAVKVRFVGYTSASDEWLAIDAIRSKLLRTETQARRGASTKRSKPAKSSASLVEMQVVRSGEPICSVSVCSNTLVREVKEQIFALVGIPVPCQVLVVEPVALMDDDAPLGDMASAPSIQVVEAHESGESAMSRLQNLLQLFIDNGQMHFSGNKGELSFFNIDILEDDTVDDTVISRDWRKELDEDKHRWFNAKPELDEGDLRAWFPEGDAAELPDFALAALQLLNEHGANGSGCFAFSKPDPWGLEGYVVGVGVAISSGAVIGWEQNGVKWD